MKTVLRRGGPSRLFGGRLKTTFFGRVKGILRGSPSENDDNCFRLLEDGFVRLLENDGMRLLESCADEPGNSNDLDATLDFTL